LVGCCCLALSMIHTMSRAWMHGGTELEQCVRLRARVHLLLSSVLGTAPA
jgi:hypothetical protein